MKITMGSKRITPVFPNEFFQKRSQVEGSEEKESVDVF